MSRHSDIKTEMATPMPAGPLRLTERQITILQMIAKGSTTEEIARQLHISTNTVRSHVRLILATLNANDRAHAVGIAMRDGLIDGEPTT